MLPIMTAGRGERLMLTAKKLIVLDASAAAKKRASP
jgi:hypothetical protein